VGPPLPGTWSVVFGSRPHKKHYTSSNPIWFQIFMRIPIAEVTPEMTTAEVVGWVHEVRDLGGLAFYLVRDRTGIIQVTIPRKQRSLVNQ
jgi:hypothetical protein